MKKSIALCLVSCALLALSSHGCAPAIVAGGATGGYKVATEERTVGQMWDDSTISTKVKTALLKDNSVHGSKIDVDTLNGVVTLTGVVETQSEIQQAVAIAGRTTGVRSITNNLQVGTKTFGQSIDDKVIVSKINAKMIAEPGIKSLNIDVDADQGVVTLSGIVDSNMTKNKIISLARETNGVKRIVDNMKLR